MDRRRFLSTLFGVGAAAVAVGTLASPAAALTAAPLADGVDNAELEKAVLNPDADAPEGLVEKAQYYYYRRRRYWRRRYYVRRRYYIRRRYYRRYYY